MSNEKKQEIKACFREIRERLQTFNEQWPSCYERGTLCTLPAHPVDEIPDIIEPELCEKDDVIDSGRAGFAQLYRRDDQKPVTALRYPGWIGLKPGDDLSRKQFKAIEEINRCKDQLRAAFLTFKPGTRNLVRKELLPGVSMMHAYRHIFAYNYVPRLLLFTWAGHTTTNRRTSVEKIQKNLISLQEDTQDASWAGALNRELQILKELPKDAPLVERRVLAPHPRVLVYGESTRYLHMCHANLPIITYAGKKAAPEVRELQVWRRTDRGKKRTDTKQYTPVIERINLYIQH